MRYYGHFEGDATTYKAPDEVAKYKAAKDPLMLFRNRVTEAGLLEGKALDEIDKASKQRIQQCVALAKSATSPTEADLLTDVYTSATEEGAPWPRRPIVKRSTKRSVRRWSAIRASSSWARTSPAAWARPASRMPGAARSASPRV